MAARVFAFLFVLLLGAPAAAAEPGWTPFSNPEFNAAISFPGQPVFDRQEDTVNNVPVVRIIVNYDINADSGLVLWATRYEGGFSDQALALKGAADAIANANVVVSRTQVMVQGVPAEDMVLKARDGSYVLATLLLVKDDVLYQIMTVGTAAPPAETASFRASFAFLNAGG